MWDCINHCEPTERRPSGGVCVFCGERVTFPATVGMSLADRLVSRFRGACRRIVVGGSLRRLRPRIRDIEIVAEAIDDTEHGQRDLFGGDVIVERTKLDAVVSDMIAAGDLQRDPCRPANGNRYKRVVWSRHEIPVDLFIVRPPATWGVILAIRTGPAEFGRELVSTLPDGMTIADGRLLDAAGNVVETSSETELFRAIGLPFVPPSERCPGTILELRRSIYRSQIRGGCKKWG